MRAPELQAAGALSSEPQPDSRATLTAAEPKARPKRRIRSPCAAPRPTRQILGRADGGPDAGSPRSDPQGDAPHARAIRYRLTDKGLRALRDYAETPVTFTSVKSDPLLRLLICGLVGEEVTRESMGTLLDDIADIQARLDDAERTARQLPHREKYLLLNIRFLRRLLDLHLDLVDDVERELAPG